MSGFADFREDVSKSPGQVAVRRALPGDLTAMLALQEQGGRSSDARSLEAAVDDGGRIVVVAHVGDNLVGWAKTHHFPEGDGMAPAGEYLGGVEVARDWRRRGIATVLTDERMKWIARRAQTAWYVVNANNPASIALHRRWGFMEVTRAPSFHGTTFTGGVGLLLRAGLANNVGGDWQTGAVPSMKGNP